MNLACTTSRLRPFGAAVLSLLVVGVGAGAALADPPSQAHNYYSAQGIRPDDRAGIHGANGQSVMAVAVQTATGVRPDDRGGIRGPADPSFMTAPTQTTNAVRPDDRAGIRGIDSTTAAASKISVGRASNFDWADAGVGAGSTLSLVLLAGGLLMARGRLRARVVHA
jgi:hypothetical protein